MTSYGLSPEGAFEDTLRDGITAAKNDSRKLARRLLERCTRMDPHDARPWLWLTEIADDPDEKREYLESALAADPNNILARRGLALLTGKIKQEDLLPIGDGCSRVRTWNRWLLKLKNILPAPNVGVRRNSIHRVNRCAVNTAASSMRSTPNWQPTEASKCSNLCCQPHGRIIGPKCSIISTVKNAARIAFGLPVNVLCAAHSADQISLSNLRKLKTWSIPMSSDLYKLTKPRHCNSLKTGWGWAGSLQMI